MKNQKKQHQIMQISKAQVQQPKKQSQHKKKSGVFNFIIGVVLLGAIAGATYIAVNSDNPFVFLAFMGVMAFIINNSQNFKDYRDVVDSATPHILPSDKAGRIPSIFIGDSAADVFEID